MNIKRVDAFEAGEGGVGFGFHVYRPWSKVSGA